MMAILHTADVGPTQVSYGLCRHGSGTVLGQHRLVVALFRHGSGTVLAKKYWLLFEKNPLKKNVKMTVVS
jgi:hypothetical protein